jgi:pyrroline-5-carboxylate reductase
MPTFGFCGAGVMASALAGGLLNTGFCNEKDIRVFDLFPETVNKFVGSRHIGVCSSNVEVAQKSDVIFLCVKPNVIPVVLSEFEQAFQDGKTKRPLIISIAAGITCDQIESNLPSGFRVVRVMPNTPCLVGQSASGYVGGRWATKEDLELTDKIFSSVGRAVHVPNEKDIDAVTGLSGSGPAYVFLFIEALADGGVRAGLSRPVALSLAIQTVKGAATMVEQTNSHPGLLKDQVCSPGGTTIAGVEALEKNGLRYATMSAVTAASDRARELRSKL